MSAPLNVILFGAIGVGKSSVINLIAGSHLAETSADVQGCTKSFKSYSFDVNGRVINIWDTMGLEEPDIGADAYLAPIGQACQLIRQLKSQGGVDLLLFCVRGTRIMEAMQSNYRLFYEVICGGQIPVALVVTHLEREVDMDEWWPRNVDSMLQHGIRAAGHACVTGLSNDSRYERSRTNIRKLLEGHDGQGRFIMPAAVEGWYLRIRGLIASLKGKSEEEAVVKALIERCRLDQQLAEAISEKLKGSEYK